MKVSRRSAWIPWLSLGVCLVAVSAGVLWIRAQRSFALGLQSARKAVNTQQYDRASPWLAQQFTRRPNDPEVGFLHGVCEEAAGRYDSANAAWARVPLKSRWGLDAAMSRSRLLIERLGRFTDAENCVKEALDQLGPRAADLRSLATQLFYWEGRLNEMRRLVQEGWNTTRDKAAALRALWFIDSSALLIKPIQATVERAAQTAPNDDRVWLARANLALLSGRFPEAVQLLEECLKRRPADPSVWRARLGWARATNSVEEARQTLVHIPAESFSAAEMLAVCAWFANREGRLDDERAALSQLLDHEPGDTEALDRLATLAEMSGQTAQAQDLRRRKAEIHRAKERYLRLLEPGKQFKQYAELASLAEKLGRRFEASGWWFLAARQEPSAEAVAATARLGPPHPDDRLPAGKMIASYLSEPVILPPENAVSKPDQTAIASRDRRSGLGEAPLENIPAFRDDAASSGLVFTLDNGRSPARQLPETMAGGVGLLDYDGDGWLDVYVVQGGSFPPNPRVRTAGDRLFRNRGDGTFEDASQRSGVSRMHRGYGHGVTVGDFDNDGHPDLFVTRWRSYALYRNAGDGTFEDVTKRAGLGGDRDWPTSAAFADFDNDGDLDLYVCHYLKWDADHPTLCDRPTKSGEPIDPNRRHDYCMPNPFPALADHLFRNDGGRFVDVTAPAGIVDTNGRGLGVIAADLDNDSRIDLFVANDSTANYLWHNLGNLRFEEIGASSGVACNTHGAFQSGMGTAIGDLDGDGRPDLTVTNFYGESTTFFRNFGNAFFADDTSLVGLAAPSRYLLGFGLVMFDANNDGRLDVAQINGHVDDNRPNFPWEMPGLILLGRSDGRLVDVSSDAGAVWGMPRLGRALAAGDLDNDGRLDLVGVPQNSALVYFHNQPTASGVHAVSFALEGTRSNRDGVGAVVTLTAGGRPRRAWRSGGGSYQSASASLLHFGLAEDKIDDVEVRWPSGRVDRFAKLEANAHYRLKEGNAKPVLIRKLGRN